MKEKTETFNQGKRYFFYILMFAILGWFIFMQIFGADERSSDTSAASVIYSGTVTWQKPDGTTQEISVPGTYKVPVGDTMVLTIVSPTGTLKVPGPEISWVVPSGFCQVPVPE